MNRFLQAICFSATVMVVTPVLAASQTFSVVVHYADLDISRSEGAQVLLRRIKQAATHACFGKPVFLDLQRQRLFDDCMKSTMDKAVASVGSPLVAGLYGAPAARTAER